MLSMVLAMVEKVSFIEWIQQLKGPFSIIVIIFGVSCISYFVGLVAAIFDGPKWLQVICFLIAIPFFIIFLYPLSFLKDKEVGQVEIYERFRQAMKKSGEGRGHVIITPKGMKDSGIGQGRTIDT